MPEAMVLLALVDKASVVLFGARIQQLVALASIRVYYYMQINETFTYGSPSQPSSATRVNV
jgi:hypothetical protein